MKSLGLKIRLALHYQCKNKWSRVCNCHVTRFKEELIRELVKNNTAFQCLNKAYQTKISNLEKEYDQLKAEVTKVCL